jgi:3-methyladenine DNA glycosylase/8-oxoguanine DNA glycosylase
MRTGTVAQSLLRAVAGQLIQASRARQIERAIIRAATPEHGGLHAPPTCADLARFSPAQLGRLGLGARRAACLIRLCRTLDLERLKAQPSSAVAARLGRERGLGPWSVGVVCIEGLGRYEHGLARDLGLAKLASALWGRWAEPEESDVLLEPYEEWAGLASVYLLAGFGRGLIPVPHATAA